MNATEEIIVSGDNFIERRIILLPQQDDIEGLQMRAYRGGYKRGWTNGLLAGIIVMGVTALCIWIGIRW
jgi:hypothetical protein